MAGTRAPDVCTTYKRTQVNRPRNRLLRTEPTSKGCFCLSVLMADSPTTPKDLKVRLPILYLPLFQTLFSQFSTCRTARSEALDKAAGILADYLGGAWTDVTSDQLALRPVSYESSCSSKLRNIPEEDCIINYSWQDSPMDWPLLGMSLPVFSFGSNQRPIIMFSTMRISSSTYSLVWSFIFMLLRFDRKRCLSSPVWSASWGSSGAIHPQPPSSVY